MTTVLVLVRGITTKEMGNTTSYQDAAHGCWEENKRLCSKKEICADGLVPYGGPFDGDYWTPTIDTFNEWISVGKNDSRKAYINDFTQIVWVYLCYGKCMQF